MKSPVAPLSAITVFLALLTGCASPGGGGYSDPLMAATDESLDADERVEAIGLAMAEYAGSPEEEAQFREAMKAIAWSRAERPTVRMRAITALAEQDESDTVEMLGLMLPTETQWPVIRGVCTLAAERGWTELAPGLVRSWAREVPEPPDVDRPERAALVALFPESAPEDVVFEVFRDPQVSELFREHARRDAWTLLTRIDETGERTKTLLAEKDLKSEDSVLLALQRGAQELHVAPRTTPQLEWLQALFEEEHAAARARYVTLVGELTDAQRAGLELRHLPGIAWAADFAPELLEASRAELMGRCERLLDGRDRIRRSSGYPDRMSAPRETLEEWDGELVWGDLLMILIADRAIEDDSVIADVFEYAQADRRDTTTEYGGVIDRVDQAGGSAGSGAADFGVTLYEPRPTQRAGDQRFIAPPEMIEESATALFHFHMQVQSVSNREYAGPSRGDLEYAREHGRSCLVFTSISSRSLNVDYYQPDGARIDLGLVRRP